jgi:AcrR family transcriptional regulator
MIDSVVNNYFANNADATYKNIDLHYGAILEKAIRNDCMGISEIARKLQVSRRTLYNWFESEKLDIEIIYKVGVVTGHNFSKEIPGFDEKKKLFAINPSTQFSDPEDNSNTVYYWMERYIHLLERYNSILRHLNIENGE